jgi:class 3 adenylate cyclase
MRPLEYLEVTVDCYNSSAYNEEGNKDSFFENEDEYIEEYIVLTRQCIAVFDNTYNMKMYYLMNLCQDFLLCLIIIFSLLSFQHSINVLVVNPIKQMTNKIKNLSLNPIAALQDNLTTCIEKQEKVFPIEISVLINTITKLCGLLTLGYGEAGAGIISSVMKDGANSDLNPMIPGKKIIAIYGFCDIRNFTDTTEVLQEKVMIFVNEVAEIVHSITSDYMGSANKNIGDAFLLVWKFRKKLTYVNKEGELCLLDNSEVHQIVDLALIAFIKIIIQIKKSHKLAKYKKNRCLNARIPNYRVKLGFGLHVGYSIEGAIGSMYKIDASYLSPNVDKAAEIQESTKEYGKSLILSQQFVDQMGEESRKQVTYLGKHDNEAIYTVELDLSNIKEDKETAERDGYEDLNLKMEHIKKRKELYKKKFEDCIKHKKDIWKEYAMKDRDIMMCRKKYTKSKGTSKKTGVNVNRDRNNNILQKETTHKRK